MRSLCLIIATLTLACSEPTEPTPELVSNIPDPAHSFVRIEVDHPVLIANGVDTARIRLGLRNASNQPLPNTAVRVATPSSNGQTTGDRPAFPERTDENGDIDGTLTTTSAGRKMLIVDVSWDGASPGKRTYTVEPDQLEFHAGPPAKLRFDEEIGAQRAGLAFAPSIGVTVVDAFDNLIEGQLLVEVRMGLDASPPGTVLSGTLTAAGDNHVAFENLRVTTIGDTFRLRASAPGLQDAVSSEFRVDAGLAAGLVFLDGPQDAVAGANLPTIRLGHVDAWGHPTTDPNYGYITLRLQRVSGEPVGVEIFGTSGKPNDGGFVRFDAVNVRTAGTYRLEANRYQFGSAVSEPFTIRAGPANAAHSLIQATPARQVADGTSPIRIDLRVRDQFDNLVPDETIAFAADSGATLSTPTARSSPLGAAAVEVRSSQTGRIAVSATFGTTVLRTDVRFGDACTVELGLPGPPRPPLGKVIAVADLDVDGTPDLIGAAPIPATGLLLARGNGDGTFTPWGSVPTSSTQIAVGDLNGDGLPDLVSGQSTIDVQFGRGDGTFGVPDRYPAEGTYDYKNGLGLADLDGDGRLDLLFNNPNFTGLSVRVNTGNGVLGASRIIPNSGSAPAVVADFNADGRPDLVTGDDTRQAVGVQFGQPGGLFSAPVYSPVGAAPDTILARDLNGDGASDVAVLTDYGTVTVLRNDGRGTFVARPQSVTLSVFASGFTLGDVDDDGDLDALVAIGQLGLIKVLWNDGTGDFTATTGWYAGAGEPRLFFADFTRDGHGDVLTSETTTALFVSRGDSTFESATEYPSGDYMNSRLVADDWNQDGFIDLVQVGNGSNYFPGVSGGGFGAKQALLSTGASDALSGDFNGNGKKDLLAAAGYVRELRFLEADASGVFQQYRVMPLAYEPTRIWAGDLDGDGQGDLVVGSATDSSLHLLLGASDGSFTAGATLPAGGRPSTIVGADFNGDGKTDFAVSHSFTKTGVALLLSHADGSWEDLMLVGGESTDGLVAADLDRDGFVDLAVRASSSSSFSGPSWLRLLFGNGDGTFRASTVSLSGPAAGMLARDLNGDGFLDLTLFGFGLDVLFGDGDGTFAPPVAYSGGYNPTGATTADVNLDGRPDLIVQSVSGTYAPLLVLPNRCRR